MGVSAGSSGTAPGRGPAAAVRDGTGQPASRRQACRRKQAPGTDSPAPRTSWALNPTSRTLQAQVELPNPKGKFLPGMYAYGSVLIERPDVRALPASAVTQIGNQTYCYLAVDGKAVRTPVQTGVSDGSWVEVAGRLVRSQGSSEGKWVPFDGSEAVIEGDLSTISDGAPVQIEDARGDHQRK